MNGLSAPEFVLKFEPLLRRVVSEEVERVLRLFCGSSPIPSLHQLKSSEARVWQLQFVDKLPSTLFTGSRIESNASGPVKIALVDSVSKEIISAGPLSSIKVEIVALDGDFGTNDLEDWTEEEFKAQIVHAREGKRPLVTGELITTLRDGVGYVGDVSFTDNSSWIRSRRFRLGAITVQGSSTDVRIREARSDAFVVKDHRGESYKKHHPPNLDDEIWRLERIAKDGAFHRRLTDVRITTVKDFLRLYHVEPVKLRKVLRISNKTWEIIVEHASDCVLDNKFYIYNMEKVGLVVNSVFKVVGATFEDQTYHKLDELNEHQKRLVENVRMHAYKNLNGFVPLDDPSAYGPAVASSSLLSVPYCSPSSVLQPLDFSMVHQDQHEPQMIFNSTAHLPYNYDVQDGSELEISVAQHYQPMEDLAQTLGNGLMSNVSWFAPYGGGTTWDPAGHLTAQGDMSFCQGNGAVGFVPSDFDIHIPRNGKHKARWCMIWAAIKWGILVRRVVAAKRDTFLQKFLDCNF
ncbi:calmodulin-binding protein 60 B-like isoform X2 [Diospyros lotus]|nr:calmodulin-binding protein 60 B-like isoform X2 [Diospyros lotus]